MPFSTARPSAFPASRPGRLWLTEGGIETEIMYKWGHDLPHFAMFPLLERPERRRDIRGMYRRYLDVAARHGFAALIGGFDYRASPDWGALLGYSAEGLAEANIRAIDFLRGWRGNTKADRPMPGSSATSARAAMPTRSTGRSPRTRRRTITPCSSRR